MKTITPSMIASIESIITKAVSTTVTLAMEKSLAKMEKQNPQANTWSEQTVDV